MSDDEAILLFITGLILNTVRKEPPLTSSDGKPSEFIKQWYKDADNTRQFYSVPTLFTLAQAGLESTWGKSKVAQNANNYFGIKADPGWKGSNYNGYRVYSSPADSFIDHAKFLIANKRYSHAFDTSDPVAFANAVAAAGYAEDPGYATKLAKVIAMVQQVVSKLGL